MRLLESMNSACHDACWASLQITAGFLQLRGDGKNHIISPLVKQFVEISSTIVDDDSVTGQ